ncbi:QsdR family transcriptional regulator [Gordonia sp. DT30]|uniref:QsdR family transcriptional regulator n=1 Tax=Gordonia sp. DT30 TaxID=3416546 RepID=UPI003CF39508
MGKTGESLAYRQSTSRDQLPARSTPVDAFEAARHAFLSGRRLDMGALARDLGVSRATLYRWTGDRDNLLADVLWVELDRLLDAAADQAGGSGVARIHAGVTWFLEAVAAADPLRALLRDDGARAVRILTAPTGPIRPRLVGRIEELIAAEVREGGYRPPAPAGVLADGIVTVGERYLHNDGDPELNPNPETARVVISLLLRE